MEGSFTLCAAAPLLFLVLTGLALVWLRRGDPHEGSCARCLYSIRGLPSAQCPECGADLRQPRTVLAPDRGRTRQNLRRIGTASAAGVLFFAAIPVFTAVVSLLPSKTTLRTNVTVSPVPNAVELDGVLVTIYQTDDVSRFPWEDAEFGLAQWIAFTVFEEQLRRSWIYYDYGPQALEINGDPTDHIGPLTRDVVETWLRRADAKLDGSAFDGTVDTLMELARRPTPDIRSFRSDDGTITHVIEGHTWRRSSLDREARRRIVRSLARPWAVVCILCGIAMLVRIERRHRARQRAVLDGSTDPNHPAAVSDVARLGASPLVGVSIVAISLLAIATGAYVVGYWRSQGFGLSFGGLLLDSVLLFVGSVLLAAPALILGSLIGALIAIHAFSAAQNRWWRMLINLVAILVLSIAIPEAWCGAQDYLVYRRNRDVPPSQKMGEARWWPFGRHHVYYDQQRGEWMGDC